MIRDYCIGLWFSCVKIFVDGVIMDYYLIVGIGINI